MTAESQETGLLTLLHANIESLMNGAAKHRDEWNDKGDSHLRVYYEGRRVALFDCLKLVKACQQNANLCRNDDR